MKAVKLLIIGREMLKLMSNHDIKCTDYKHIGMCEEYIEMRKNGDKVDYILRYLSERYKLSESTIKRVIKRLLQEVMT